MQKQSGMCAFTNACTVPGPRVLLPGTNREFCNFHIRALALPLPAPSAEPFGFGGLRKPATRRRGRWL